MNEFTNLLESYSKMKKRTLSVKMKNLREGFEEDPVEETPAEGGMDPMMGDPMMMEPVGALESSPYADEACVEAVGNILKKTKLIFDSLTREERKFGDFGKTLQDFEDFLVGIAPHSIEQQIALSVGEEGPLDKTLIIGVIENLAVLIGLLSKNKIADDSKKRMGTIMSIGLAGSVVIHNKGSEGEGLVFKDTFNFLKTLAFACKRKYSVVFPSYDEQSIGAGAANETVNKLGLKGMMPSINSSSRFQETQEEPVRQGAEDMVNDFKPGLHDNLQAQRNFGEGYHAGTTAISLEDQAQVESSSQMLGDGLRGIMNNFIGIGREVYQTRKPDFIIPTEAGFCEGWVSEKSALEALRSLGFTPEDIKIDNLVTRSPAKEAFSDALENLQVMKRSGIIQSVNQKVYTITIKSEFHLKLDDYMVGETLFSELPPSPFQEQCLAIEAKIRKLAVKGLVKLEDGGNTLMYPLKETATNLVERLKRTSSYDEITGNNAVGQVIRTIEENDLSTKDGAERTREAISRFLIFTKLDRECKVKTPAVVQYLKEIFTSIVSQSEAVTSVNALHTPDIVSFRESSVVSKVMKAWLHAEYIYSADKYSLRWCNKDNQAQCLSLTLAPCTVEGEEFLEKRFKFEVKFSKELQGEFSRKPLVPEETMLEVYMNQQKEFLTLLLNRN